MAQRKFASVDEFEEWLTTFDRIRLNRQACFLAGNYTALYDALTDALDTDGEPKVPRWVLEALLDDTIVRAMNALNGVVRTGQAARRGRPSGVWNAAIWRRDVIDWFRFKQVWYRRIARRDHDPEHPRFDVQQSRRLLAHRCGAIETGTPYPWNPPGTTGDLSVFEAVSAMFVNSAYAGSSDEVRKSYARVTDSLNAGEAWRYYPSKWLRIEPVPFVDADGKTCEKGQLIEADTYRTK